jgi:serine/threonine protein kinase/Tol biopolymer transport system component
VNLAPGTRLGPYEIVNVLGQGGMGTVYGARDTRLQRSVALKLVLDEFVADRERTARFEQEARTLASLNHPNIATLHGIEHVDGRHLLVMELVEGETLADKISRHPAGMPLDEALDIARQIAGGLEAAHEKGIVHRDLKPANIRITPGDVVKVLDFGLAKAMAGSAVLSGAGTMNSPTYTSAGTALGIVLGTAAYMAPEQARGKAVDRRADIWAFGVVLFEMLTGRRLFAGESVSDIIAAVLTKEPDFTLLPASVPGEVRQVLRRCLERDPRRRLRDIGDARLELDGPFTASGVLLPAAAVAPAKPRTSTPVIWIALALGTALIAGLLWRGRPTESPAAMIQFDIRPPAGASLVLSSRPAVAVSRDGSNIAFIASSADGSRLYLRNRSAVDLQEIPGTREASDPAFSPDGRWIAFATTSQLVKVTLDGKTRVELAALSDPRGLAWIDDQNLVLAPNVGTGLFVVPASGGPIKELTTVDRQAGERSHRWPATVPGGKAVLFTIGTEGSPDDYSDAHIDAVTVATGARKRVLDSANTVRCTDDGRLLFMRRGVLFTVRFDAATLATIGEPAAVLPGVEGDSTTGAGHYAISAEGTLVHVPGLSASGMRRLAWVDRTGQRTLIDIPPAEFNEPAVSPDGKRLAVIVGTIGRSDIWTYELDRKVFSRLTFEGHAASPAWSPDGKSIYYFDIDPKTLTSTLLRKPVDGSGQSVSLATLGGRAYLGFMDPQERFAVVMQVPKGQTANSDVLRVPLQPPAAPVPIAATAAIEYAPAVSPDGRLVAYVSTVSGVQEIWVRELNGTGQWQISTSSGIGPRWSADGRELFFKNDAVQMVVPIESSPGFSAGQPRPLFTGVFNWRTEAGMNYALDHTTGRFLIILPPSAADPGAEPAVRVMINWR